PKENPSPYGEERIYPPCFPKENPISQSEISPYGEERIYPPCFKNTSLYSKWFTTIMLIIK
ncbi:hypothetical protein, partial [Waltera sp.]|uniref:hypothetical protein n=1 Tax=Waltera sp. TaxID=2815806 RepID=UPI003079B679